MKICHTSPTVSNPRANTLPAFIHSKIVKTGPGESPHGVTKSLLKKKIEKMTGTGSPQRLSFDRRSHTMIALPWQLDLFRLETDFGVFRQYPPI